MGRSCRGRCVAPWGGFRGGWREKFRHRPGDSTTCRHLTPVETLDGHGWRRVRQVRRVFGKLFFCAECVCAGVDVSGPLSQCLVWRKVWTRRAAFVDSHHGQLPGKPIVGFLA